MFILCLFERWVALPQCGKEQHVSRPDLNALLNALLPFAQRMLTEHGEFYPFGASMNQAGEISMEAINMSGRRTVSREVVGLLENEFRTAARSGEIRAIGICLEVRLVPPGKTVKTDAIKAVLEHIDGEAIDTFLPYTRGFLGKTKYGEIFASQATPRIFGAGVAT